MNRKLLRVVGGGKGGFVSVAEKEQPKEVMSVISQWMRHERERFHIASVIALSATVVAALFLTYIYPFLTQMTIFVIIAAVFCFFGFKSGTVLNRKANVPDALLEKIACNTAIPETLKEELGNFLYENGGIINFNALLDITKTAQTKKEQKKRMNSPGVAALLKYTETKTHE
jgi:hypothetical protein